jgi:hypothetical protein
MVHVTGINSCLLEVFVDLDVLVDFAHTVRLPDIHPIPSDVSSSDDAEMLKVFHLLDGQL